MTVTTVMEEERPEARSVCGSCCSLAVVVRNTAQLLSLSIREYCRPSHTTTSRNTGDILAMVVSSVCRCAWVRLLMLSGRTRGCWEGQQDLLQRSTWDTSTQHRSDLDLQSTSSSQLSLEIFKTLFYCQASGSSSLSPGRNTEDSQHQERNWFVHPGLRVDWAGGLQLHTVTPPAPPATRVGLQHLN